MLRRISISTPAVGSSKISTRAHALARERSSNGASYPGQHAHLNVLLIRDTQFFQIVLSALACKPNECRNSLPGESKRPRLFRRH